MLNGKTAAAAFAMLAFLLLGVGLADELEDNWNDFLHYTKIGRFDLAKGYAQAILDSNPEPTRLLELARASEEDYRIMLKVNEMAPDEDLAELTGKILKVVEEGRFERRSDDAIVAAEVRRLSSTERGWLIAVERLQNAGEYAIPFMLQALADDTRQDEWEDIVRALPLMGKDAIRPLAAALQMDNVRVEKHIIEALGGIGYPQALPYLKYVVEKDDSSELRDEARGSIAKINPEAARIPSARLFHQLGENYYYHTESLEPKQQSKYGNIWFWDEDQGKLTYEIVDRAYFYELMAMRCCEWALKADPSLGNAISLWIASFFKAESAGVAMPLYFGDKHADALVYATTAGVEYLHEALARAVKDKNAYVALGIVEALATTAGEESLLYTVGPVQPLSQALSFDNRAVRYSAAIAIAAAGPTQPFAEHKLVVRNLVEALRQKPVAAGEDTELWSDEIARTYSIRAARVMFKLAQSRNRIIDLSLARDALIEATGSERPEMQKVVCQTLAYLDSPDAQRAVAAVAMNEANSLEVRISAFESLGTSAKMHGNMLVDQTIDALYGLISSDQTDANLRSAAAAAYGSLNLPSRKVKDLILDQARS